MNRTQFIEEVLSQTPHLKKIDIDLVLSHLINSIQENVSIGEKVTIAGFGTFEPRNRKAMRRVNPATQEPVDVPAKTAPGFRAGAVFKRQVQNNCDRINLTD